MLLILIILFCPLSFTYNTAWLMCGMVVILFFITAGKASSTQRTIAMVWFLLPCFPLFSALPITIPIGGTCERWETHS